MALKAQGFRPPEPAGIARMNRTILKDPQGTAPVRTYTAAEIAAFNK